VWSWRDDRHAAKSVVSVLTLTLTPTLTLTLTLTLTPTFGIGRTVRIRIRMRIRRRHGVTMATLLLALIALPGIDAGVIDLTLRKGRVLNTYPPLADSNIKTAAQLWVSNQASATSTYGLVDTWDLSQVTSLAYLWCGWDATNCGEAYVAMQSFNGNLSQWDVAKVTTMRSSKSTPIVENNLT
jgi:hypothetical protein